ncbi:hypothetical protein [Streptococcus equi]|uniref:hypothetical protein n=1 Tax=Streptococcus equi TaxID=1336 RepID=UPI001E4EB5B1|nr:hypothetical protein [Streptococcus equi]MCD3384983.1 hypothetical protein [Streptococcus equi subsp. zooepidemicus]MCD3393362.1 hypothetical protein [Streptococcus equi subsp. zooepidemicus]MDI5902817.1 hypothetical protein [Streptococcus equi subsp. zooepidemicus]MDI5931546.1 hypothetical protein [Streptococcus equi subsp. zooepidemicus]MDI6030855.1 hypothetical protein [Streptococcus equi subsp. zooepidemicus]
MLLDRTSSYGQSKLTLCLAALIAIGSLLGSLSIGLVAGQESDRSIKSAGGGCWVSSQGAKCQKGLLAVVCSGLLSAWLTSDIIA